MAFDGLVRLAERSGLANTIPVLERSLKHQPGSDRVRANLLYVRFLLGKQREEDLPLAAALALRYQKQSPTERCSPSVSCEQVGMETPWPHLRI